VFAKKLNLVYIEVSAKTGQNVPLAFEMITEKILEKIDKKEINPEEEVLLHDAQLGIKVGAKGSEPDGTQLKQGEPGSHQQSAKCCQ
jgi:GTPase SAR1 family protein